MRQHGMGGRKPPVAALPGRTQAPVPEPATVPAIPPLPVHRASPYDGSKPLTILSLPDCYGDPPLSGGEWAAVEVHRRLAALGHSVIVGVGGDSPADATTAGIRILRGRGVEDAHGLVTEFRPHVVMCQFAAVRPALKALRESQIPVVVTVHSAAAWRELEEYGLTGLPALILWDSAWLMHSCGGRGLVMRPMVSPGRLTAKRPGKRGDATTLVNLFGPKGAEVFWRLTERFPLRPFLGIRGGYGTQIEHPVRPGLTVIGPTRDMGAVYAQTRVLLMPSWEEGFGLVGIEAQAAGIPVIASNLPSLHESLGDGAIFVPRPQMNPTTTDVAMWAGALTSLDDPDAYTEVARRGAANVKRLDVEAGQDVALLDGTLRALARHAPARPVKAPSGAAEPVVSCGNLDTLHPYLQWVSPGRIEEVTEPLTIPRRQSRRRRILIVTATLTVGGAERIAKLAAEWLSDRHDVRVWVMGQTEADVYWVPSGGAFYGPGALDDVLAFRPEVAVLSNAEGLEHAKILASTGCAVLTVPYGLTHWNYARLKSLDGALLSCRALWAYPRICGGLRQFGLTLPTFAFRGPSEAAPEGFRRDEPDGVTRILYAGRPALEKNIPAAAAVVDAMAKMYPDRPVRLVVASGVDEKAPPAYLAYFRPCWTAVHDDPRYRAAQDLGVVEEIGLQSDMEPIYARADACLLTSNLEGEPVVFLEAMHRGVICAGRSVGEIPTLLGDGRGIVSQATGMVATEAEVKHLAAGLWSVLEDRARRSAMSDAARSWVQTRHGREAWVSQFEAVIGEVLTC